MQKAFHHWPVSLPPNTWTDRARETWTETLWHWQQEMWSEKNGFFSWRNPILSGVSSARAILEGDGWGCWLSQNTHPGLSPHIPPTKQISQCAIAEHLKKTAEGCVPGSSTDKNYLHKQTNARNNRIYKQTNIITSWSPWAKQNAVPGWSFLS